MVAAAEESSSSPVVEMNRFQKSDSNSSVGSNSTSASSSRNEWRRKSYGFEKMTPPPESMSQCMESSTDSGIGRSGGDLHSHPLQQSQLVTTTSSPLASSTAKNNGTIVHISNPSTTADNYQNYRSSFRNSLSSSTAARADNPTKRHSIAVADDRKYLSESFKDSLQLGKPAQASVNGFNVIFSSTHGGSNNVTSTTAPVQQQSNSSKRVEFCKTEVHFAPESGRVNIVETDGKPPPTNNFRRRRSSTQYLTSEEETEANYCANVDQVDQNKSLPVEPIKSINGALESRNEEEVRGILKNKPIKPKPYHLGENCADGESLFGVRLRPVSGDYSNWTPTPRTTTPTVVQTTTSNSMGNNNNPKISLYKEPDSGERPRQKLWRVWAVEEW